MATLKRDSTALKVLFIGNSFTARNDLPGLIAQLAAARGQGLRHHLISAGGASLRAHWNAAEARRAIQDGQYDHVVLQEQSTLPAKNAQRMHENVRLFDEAIKAAGAKTALYMTWARLRDPQSQQAITDAYASIGQELGATVVPVGLAWRGFLSSQARPALHNRDQSHPTLAGSYLAACVFLAVLFKESPVGLSGEMAGLGAENLVLLQEATWQVCKPTARTRRGRTSPLIASRALRQRERPRTRPAWSKTTSCGNPLVYSGSVEWARNSRRTWCKCSVPNTTKWPRYSHFTVSTNHSATAFMFGARGATCFTSTRPVRRPCSQALRGYESSHHSHACPGLLSPSPRPRPDLSLRPR